MPLEGFSRIGSEKGSPRGESFQASDPASGEKFAPVYYSAGHDDVEHAAQKASQAFAAYGNLSGKRKAELLNTIAATLEAGGNEIVERARRKTGLPEDKLQGTIPLALLAYTVSSWS